MRVVYNYVVPEDDAPSVETRQTLMFNIFNFQLLKYFNECVIVGLFNWIICRHTDLPTWNLLTQSLASTNVAHWPTRRRDPKDFKLNYCVH